MDMKVFNEWLARYEEAVKCYERHKSQEWLEQVVTAKLKLKELYLRKK